MVGVVLAAALTANVPLGMWRSGLRRLSPSWVLAVHASVPLLVGMRFALGMASWVIPPEIALAVVGQLLGARLLPLWGRSRD
ncbi:MAG: hypothetical protein ACE5IZ_02820 [Dehalococcoidia bacterium]